MRFIKNLFAFGLVASMFLSSGISWGKGADTEKTLLRRAPIIGLVQEGKLPMLVKGKGKSKVRIQFREAGSDKVSVTGWYPLKSKNDFTANIWLSEIKPATPYEYQVEFKKNRPTDWKKFTTPPAPSQSGKLRFAFSSCLREKYRPHFIFDFLKGESLDFMALLGDNIYGDYDGNLNDIDKIREDKNYREKLLQEGEPLPREESVLDSFRQKYHRNFDKHFQGLSSVLPMVVTWDDHDFGEDGSDGTYPYKEISKQVFNETFPVQPYVEPEGGLYYRFSAANVDFFVIDSRWYKSPMGPDGPGHTLLGEKQLQWLLEGLKKSEEAGHPFKIILSSMSWSNTGGDRSKNKEWFDNWEGYAEERKKVLDFIEAHQIRGVFTLSGDQHYPSFNVLNWKEAMKPLQQGPDLVVYSLASNPTALFDLSASPLDYKRAIGETLPPGTTAPPGIREIYRIPWAIKGHPSEPYHAKKITSIYAFVDVDTASPVPSVTVTFKELDFEVGKLKELYRIQIQNQ